MSQSIRKGNVIYHQILGEVGVRLEISFSQSQYLRVKEWLYSHLSYDVASGSEITPCNKIDMPLVATLNNVAYIVTKL